MKRTVLLMACMLASVVMQAQESQSDYLPFVKDGKQWTVIRSEFGEHNHFDFYKLMNEKVEKSGKTYVKMYRSEDLLDVVYDQGLLREEDRKVYYFDESLQKEFLMFDYSLNRGDTYETYSYDEGKMVTYKVLSVGYCSEGPKVFRYERDEFADSMNVYERFLRQWKVCRTDNESFQKTWIEGVGSLEGPLVNLYDSRPVSICYYLAYVSDGLGFYPFSFYDSLNRNIHGCDLPTWTEYQGEGDRHHLTYEQVGDRLHVNGKVFTQCGPNNYAYFIEEPTDDPLVHKLQFIIQEVEPLADCKALHATDFYVPGFDPNMNYIVVDNQGEEHPVINRTPRNDYRPFVEDGKVWKVGYGSDNPVQRVEYYYFDGDTIIDGKNCKQMMRQRYVTPDYADYDVIKQLPLLSPVSVWYEADMKVYTYDSASQQFQLMYDFSANADDTLSINNQLYTIGPRLTGGLKGFKGVYREVGNHMSWWNGTWLEGVGSIEGPIFNVYYGKEYHGGAFLMSCTVGDEVIYLNDDYEDGATPEASEARKSRFDFTHIAKPRPKAPKKVIADSQRDDAMQSLYGEYNNQQLSIRLDPLDEAYLVRITDSSDKVLYEKAVNASNIIGINIDISAYAKGRYTVTVENSRESFIGQFEAQTTGIVAVKGKGMEARGGIYNLQGQRVRTLQKGLNVVNGKKVIVHI